MTDTDERALFWLRASGEIIGLLGTLWITWRFFVPEHAKDHLGSRFNSWIWHLGESERKRRARDRLIFDLGELSRACPCEVSREVDRLSRYHSRR